ELRNACALCPPRGVVALRLGLRLRPAGAADHRPVVALQASDGQPGTGEARSHRGLSLGAEANAPRAGAGPLSLARSGRTATAPALACAAVVERLLVAEQPAEDPTQV